jgi:hypothetical protein
MERFASVIDVERFLQIEIPADSPTGTAAIERALIEATSAIREYTDQYLSLVEDDELLLDSRGGNRILLPELPIVAIDTVEEGGVELVRGTDYELSARSGILHRLRGRWARGFSNIRVVYTHGYDPIPQTIVDVCTRAAARGYQAGLRAKQDEGVLGVNSKSLGDFSVGYGSEHGGGVGDGPLGASGARMLLMSEKDLLDRFRI